MLKKIPTLKSKYFALTHFEFTKKQVKEVIKDLKRVLKIFEKKLALV